MVTSPVLSAMVSACGQIGERTKLCGRGDWYVVVDARACPSCLVAHHSPITTHRSPHIHLDHAALALDGDDALAELVEDGAGVGQAVEVEPGRRAVVGEDLDRADVHDAVEQPLLEADVVHV